MKGRSVDFFHPEACPVCLWPASPSFEDERDITTVDCPQCGRFRVTFEAKQDLMANTAALGDRQSRRRANASGWLNKNPGVLLTLDGVEALASLPTPGFLSRAESIMAGLEQESTFVGEGINLRILRYTGISSSVRQDELEALLRYVKERTWIEWSPVIEGSEGASTMSVKVTPAGWIHLDEIRGALAASNQAFIAMSFADTLTSAYTDGLERAVRLAGYEAVRMDAIEHIDKIDDRIIAEIRRSKFLIADLTEQRGGVYYEAGFAMGLGLPVIWTCRDDQLSEVHFDVRQYNCIFWKSPDDLRDRMRCRIESLMGSGPHPGA